MAQFALLAALAVHGDAERAASLGDPPAGMPEVVVPYWQFFELLALLELDRYGDALDLARRGLADARAQFDRPRVYLFTYALAHCLFRMGHWAQATTLISETLALGSPASHSSPGQASYEALLRMGALLMFLSGHRRAAASLLHGVTGSADGPMAWMQQATGDAIRALMDGDEVGAADHLTRGGRDSGLRGYGVGQRVSYLYAMWFDPTLERLDRLDAVSAASSSPERHGPFRRYLRAVLEHPASIATVAGDYESFEDLPLAVLVTRRLASRAADPSAREAAERAAELLADRLGRDLQETPRVAADPALLLTDREFEVALLVGARSNSQIAVSLQLSRRTVENHVHRALKKTGAQTREELTLIAGRSRHRR
jgi:DNA-binding CsgD family transcriptional regulator